jgi:PAS domain S-box-containing protein
MMQEESTILLSRVRDLEEQLSEAQQFIRAIQEGEVDAFAIRKNNVREVYTLESGDYAYRVLIEKFGEGALNLTEDGLIVYCNAYFSELLDIAYEKVIGSFIFDWIAEGSDSVFRELFAAALTGNSKGEVVFYVRGRSIPVYISLTSLQPNLPTVGMIITNLTEKKRHEEVIANYNLQLAVKNQELESQNNELASFAYVASHDLQEPLRKIQAFTSRILAKEEQNFSEAGRDYFARIRSAATRMQKLIEDLLSYSRTNSFNLVLKPTDLNTVLAEVKKNLMYDIQEKNVLIESTELPVLNLVSMQFHQLLLNLIANSIKYSRPDIRPHIKISACLLTTSDVSAAAAGVPTSHSDWPEDNDPSDKYWKISVEDNGIGFKQEYAERIFELFQRLHGRAEYDGTGVGLAICKKIVQNHNGFINACGQPGVGATFAIFLPASHSHPSSSSTGPATDPAS